MSGPSVMSLIGLELEGRWRALCSVDVEQCALWQVVTCGLTGVGVDHAVRGCRMAFCEEGAVVAVTTVVVVVVVSVGQRVGQTWQGCSCMLMGY